MSKFGELISAQVPVLIDFYTDWNESSIAMHPVIRDVAAALVTKLKSLRLM
jgi:thioredoxin 1